MLRLRSAIPSHRQPNHRAAIHYATSQFAGFSLKADFLPTSGNQNRGSTTPCPQTPPISRLSTLRRYIFHRSHSRCRRDALNKSSLPPSTPAPPSFVAKSRNGRHDLSTTNERPRPLTEAPTPPASPRAMLRSGVPPSRLPATLPRYSPAAPGESGGGTAARHSRAQGHAATAAAMAGREPSASQERAGRADGRAVTPPVPIGCSSPAGPRPAAWTAADIPTSGRGSRGLSRSDPAGWSYCGAWARP